MASELVDGLRIPLRLAGRAALDFCNTRAGWGTGQPKEYLLDYAHLAVWAREAGLVDRAEARTALAEARERPAKAAEELERAIAFREALYATCLEPGAAWAEVARTIERAAGSARLELRNGRGAWTLPAGLALPLDAVARAAEALVTSPELALVRRCPGAGCGWLFLDPRGRRRWCTMAICGNRAKARRHAARARAAQAL